MVANANPHRRGPGASRTTPAAPSNADVPPPGATQVREPFVDFMRAFSLLVVVLWHWVFTIVVWKPDGPHATSPIGFTSGLWLATWLLQVLPLFFYIGGYAHLRALASVQRRGGNVWTLVRSRLKQLAIPSFALLGVWGVLGTILAAVFNVHWAWRAITLVVSPLWFIGVYLMLVLDRKSVV
jgi:hypothetical protein